MPLLSRIVRHKLQTLFFGGGVLLLLVAAVVILKLPEAPSVRIREVTYAVSVADTAGERARGLSNQAGIRFDQGMLFVHDASGVHCYWMKDMKFSIDILWFDESRRLIHSEKSVSPESYPKSFCPAAEAKYVLEVTSGSVERQGFRAGDQLQLINL
jgi:uncharacterized membrane protein (UPF0127 family)